MAQLSPEEQIVKENMVRIIKENKFSIRTSNGKIYVDISDKSTFYFAVCNFLALKLPNWPSNAEIRLVGQQAQVQPSKNK